MHPYASQSKEAVFNSEEALRRTNVSNHDPPITHVTWPSAGSLQIADSEVR